MVLKYTNSKQKFSGINAAPLCLGNVSKDFSADNMKKTGLHGNVHDFSVNYDIICVDYLFYDLLDIHKYLMKKHDIK